MISLCCKNELTTDLKFKKEQQEHMHKIEGNTFVVFVVVVVAVIIRSME